METALCQGGELSIARLTQMVLADFIEHIDWLGIPMINQMAEEVD
jgi:hypothetical protein